MVSINKMGFEGHTMFIQLHQMWNILQGVFEMCFNGIIQDKIFRRKRLSTGANFVHVYKEVWDKGILKFNKFSM